jgi:predicted methyltransferase
MRRSRLLAIALAVVLLGGAAGGAYGIWYLFLKPGGPPAVALSSATPGSSAGATATVSGASPAGVEGNLDG